MWLGGSISAQDNNRIRYSINTNLGITSTGDATLFLNQQGNWISPIASIAQPVGQVVYGTGTGITSNANLIFTGTELDVLGKTKTINFQMTNGAVNNYVLQSDASGNGTWVAIGGILPVTTVSNTSSANNLTTTVNSTTGTAVNIINSNSLTQSGASITSSLNGVSASLSPSLSGDVSGNLNSTSVDKLKGTSLVITSLANTDILQYNGTNWINVLPTSIIPTTTNTLSLSTNTLTSTVNGVAATANTVSSVSNSSSTNTLSTSVNGVTGTGVNIINSNSLTQSGASITSSVNGISSSVSPSLAGDVSGSLNTTSVDKLKGTSLAITSLATNNILQYNGTNWVNVTPSSIIPATTNTLSLSTNTLTSTVNGIAATSNAISAVSNTSSTNTLSTTVNGVTGTGVNIINSHTLSLSTNTLTSSVNGVSATSSVVGSVSNTSSANNLSTTVNGVTGSNVNIINSVSNTSSTNTLSTTINGVAGTGVNIINSNSIAWTQAGGLSSTVNGVASTLIPASGTIAQMLGYNTSGVVVYAAPTSISANYGNIVLVSPLGNDGTGAKYNISLPYKTISAAVTAASSGDTIYVLPGTYTDTGIWKDGVAYYFSDGVTISPANTTTLFTITSPTVDVVIDGFLTVNSSQNGIVFDIISIGSTINVYLKFKYILATAISGNDGTGSRSVIRFSNTNTGLNIVINGDIKVTSTLGAGVLYFAYDGIANFTYNGNILCTAASSCIYSQTVGNTGYKTFNGNFTSTAASATIYLNDRHYTKINGNVINTSYNSGLYALNIVSSYATDFNGIISGSIWIQNGGGNTLGGNNTVNINGTIYGISVIKLSNGYNNINVSGDKCSFYIEGGVNNIMGNYQLYCIGIFTNNGLIYQTGGTTYWKATSTFAINNNNRNYYTSTITGGKFIVGKSSVLSLSDVASAGANTSYGILVNGGTLVVEGVIMFPQAVTAGATAPIQYTSGSLVLDGARIINNQSGVGAGSINATGALNMKVYGNSYVNLATTGSALTNTVTLGGLISVYSGVTE